MITRISYSEELKKLRHNILEMATRVEENLGKAISALRTYNADLANEVQADDTEVDILQYQIEDQVAVIIATQQPVARDLREMVTIIKLTSNIERVGDHAVHLSKAAKKLAKKGDTPQRAQEFSTSPKGEVSRVHLENMAKTGQKMLRSAIAAFMNQDAAAAREAAAMDTLIDDEHKVLTEDVLKLMKKHPEHIKSAFQLLHTSNQLERLGDHITNICEAVIYMIEGTREDLNE